MSDFMDHYERQEAENRRVWAERAQKKTELYDEAARVLDMVRASTSGVMPEQEGDKWVAVRPETAIQYAEALMKLGHYWDGTRLYGAVEDVAHKIR